MTDRVFLDTNVLAHAFGPDTEPKQARARELLFSMRRTVRLVVSAQVMSELYVVLTKKLKPPLSPVTARAAVELVGKWEVVPVDADLVLAALDRQSRSQLSYWDAQIVEAARRARCVRLLSEDMGDQTDFDGTVVTNPFR